jgi:hypothetical protein
MQAGVRTDRGLAEAVEAACLHRGSSPPLNFGAGPAIRLAGLVEADPPAAGT